MSRVRILSLMLCIPVLQGCLGTAAGITAGVAAGVAVEVVKVPFKVVGATAGLLTGDD